MKVGRSRPLEDKNSLRDTSNTNGHIAFFKISNSQYSIVLSLSTCIQLDYEKLSTERNISTLLVLDIYSC